VYGILSSFVFNNDIYLWWCRWSCMFIVPDFSYAITNTGFILGSAAAAQLPSVIWRCWLHSRKDIWPVKNWVVGYWCGYLGFAYGPANATATHSLSSEKSRMVLPFWCRVTRVVLDKIQRAVKQLYYSCSYNFLTVTHTNKHTHTHTPFYSLLGFCPGLPGWASTRKVKPIWIYWSKR